MQLFYSHASPYARTCRAVLRESGLAARVREQMVDPLSNPQDLISSNPLGKIPALVLDDGETLYDSQVINEYFISIGSGPDLWTPIRQNWAARRALALSQGLLDVAVGLRIEKTKPDAQQSAFWMDRQRAALRRGLDQVQAERPRMPLIDTLLGLHLCCMLGYLDFRHDELNWQASHPALAEWYLPQLARPCLAETQPR